MESLNNVIKLMSGEIVKTNELKVNQQLSQFAHAVPQLSLEMLQQVIRKQPKVYSKQRVQCRLPPPLIQRLPDSSPIRKQKRDTSCKLAVDRIVKLLGLLDEPSYKQRMNLFVGYCHFRNYSANTMRTYFRRANSLGVFGPDYLYKPPELDGGETQNSEMLRPTYRMFRGKPRSCVIGKSEFAQYALYLHKNFSKFTAPLLFAFYTGLRAFEVLQVSSKTLCELLEEKVSVTSVVRKNTRPAEKPPEWRPTYHQAFIRFVHALSTQPHGLYYEEVAKTRATGIPIPLFPIVLSTLTTRLKTTYYQATGKALPLGCGIHLFRHMVALYMSAETQNIHSVREFLQHKHYRVTSAYMQSDRLNLTRQCFEAITRDVTGEAERILRERDAYD